jgi:DNA (cytosine-5)-methyltransferase 1
LNSYDFGVPQNRDRIFVIGFRKDLQVVENFTYPKSLKVKPKLFDILENIQHKAVKKQKINVEELHGSKIPLSRNRFQKIDELNDFFVFCDTRNGHSTIHSWDIIRTSKKEKEICMTILKNRRKKKYGMKDGNPLSYIELKELVGKLEKDELEELVSKNILKKVEEKYEFQNSKNSAGINGIYRIYLPNSDIFSTLTATGTKDMIALENVEGKDVNEFKSNFINKIYKKKRYRPISSREAGRLQGFPNNFAVHPNEAIAKKQFGNAVSIPVIFNLVNEVIKTGILNDTERGTSNNKGHYDTRNLELLQEFSQ